ncbi:MAG: hypothetical protein KJO52_11475 [Maribacter sp.]|nr:hypothetical protein [Maribacter sp.]MBT8300541.1 hypothetical protein [Maribacter sp.]NNK18083.1 hypothetical protein [Maribacter sp.]
MYSDIEDFFFNNYFMAFYVLALAFALVRYRRYFDTALKHLPILIAYTLITEILGLLIRENEDIQLVYIEGYSYYNSLIFNIFDLVFFLYFFYVFWITITDVKFRNLTKWGALLFIIASVINAFLQDFVLYPQILASSIGSVVLIGCVLKYYGLLRRNVQTRKRHDLLFWISLGLLLFYAFYPFILLIGYFDYELYQKLHIRLLQHALIALMYSCFILGFIRMKRIRPTEDL